MCVLTEIEDCHMHHFNNSGHQQQLFKCHLLTAPCTAQIRAPTLSIITHLCGSPHALWGARRADQEGRYH